MTRTLLAAAAALLLAGCGGPPPDAPPGASAAETRVLAVAQGIGRLFGGSAVDDVGRPPVGPEQFAPEAIAAAPGAYRIVQINALGINELGRIIQTNGPRTTLALQSGPTAAFDAGILTATRGFGDDLLTIDAPGLLGLLRAGGGSLTRTAETLDAQDQVVTTRFACQVRPAGRETVDLGLRQATLARFDENCRSDRLIFDNIYWLDERGEIAASRQYVSPTVAYLRANRL
ncbi:YjbF family lipoprotein [Rubellimicrobium sp. CFH 75288]|uniref:YjbF family lipoprotein n=1 Tax=Rubellimicrobium sp. CFH 75288 TaxID=2697034 RepID=UPI00141269C5|nr:YjbF family lipoprotein [Rubellimicrobium sp. CFH 75288]